MIEKYSKLLILAVVLLVLITLITLVMIFDVDFGIFKNLSIAGMQQKDMIVQTLIAKQEKEEQNNEDQKTKLQTSKNNFDVAKQEYENIDESTIALAQEATKEVKYFIEYLWIVLGNYAAANNVAIDIYTPGDTAVSTTTNTTDNKTENKTENTTNNTTNSTTENTNNSTVTDTTTNTDQNTGTSSDTTTNSTTTVLPSVTTPVTSGVKITIKGRYANVADFVFDVENDKSLKFKLDNIKMAYAKDNKIQATFDVLSLSVLK